MKIKFLITLPILAACALSFSACSDSELNSRVDVLRQMNQTLAEAQDTATADAAAPRYDALVEMLEKCPPTSEADVKVVDVLVGQLFSQAARLSREDYYQSEALKQTLRTPREQD